jgi:hypothetical protein
MNDVADVRYSNEVFLLGFSKWPPGGSEGRIHHNVGITEISEPSEKIRPAWSSLKPAYPTVALPGIKFVYRVAVPEVQILNYHSTRFQVHNVTRKLNVIDCQRTIVLDSEISREWIMEVQ